MRLALITMLVLLTACASPAYVTQLEENVSVTSSRADALDAQLADTTRLLNEALERASTFESLYEGKLAEVSSLQDQVDLATKQLAFQRLQSEKFRGQYEECVAKYVPKVVSTASYTTVPYDDLMRYSDEHVGQLVRFDGEVVQVSDNGDGSFTLRVAVTEEVYFFTDPIWVEYAGPRVLEEDIVTIYGTFTGLQTYTAVFGNDITIPAVDADSIKVVTKAGDR
ncbi:MAG: hypothetical protein ACSLFQ_02100 [Thermoanaerobaculia bacterium]